ncbi:hypothetical protein GYMLUDRAFT_252315 [Collybiopsis luxurians FD-317 M1]|uniref:Uncharacterized protein n=1 Tax=Collybiopsis luxurians FD-317 M1 TaxID=944289 RepID=A0A0D0ALP0_9AGAR|nr:hypothetical protein GYMLUDRAFT_252315 [Collybiopsis luxurians FD-317 M1]
MLVSRVLFRPMPVKLRIYVGYVYSLLWVLRYKSSLIPLQRATTTLIVDATGFFTLDAPAMSQAPLSSFACLRCEDCQDTISSNMRNRQPSGVERSPTYSVFGC